MRWCSVKAKREVGWGGRRIVVVAGILLFNQLKFDVDFGNSCGSCGGQGQGIHADLHHCAVIGC
jgi:hypothetical protein